MNKLEQIRWLLSLLALALLILGCYWIMKPFLLALCWAVVIVLPSWPLYRALCRFSPKHPGINALTMTLVLALLLTAAVLPLLLALSGEMDEAMGGIQNWLAQDRFTLPEFIHRIPYLGPFLEERIGGTFHNKKQLLAFLGEYQRIFVDFATTIASGIFSSIITLSLCLFIAYFLFRNGKELGRQINVAAGEIGGERFQSLVLAIRSTVKGAVYGVLLTAVAQGFLAGIGYYAASAPVPLLLGLTTMVMALVPFGTPLVYIPVSIFIVVNGLPLYFGVLLALWGVFVVSMSDNILRPLFISQSTSMPILLSFFGVIGGLLQFGMIGIFLGPVILAVAHAIWMEFINSQQKQHYELSPDLPESDFS